MVTETIPEHGEGTDAGRAEREQCAGDVCVWGGSLACWPALSHRGSAS